MSENKFLESVMDQNYCRTLTICGSTRFRELQEKYQAYYTTKNNLVLAPVNYSSIKEDVETTLEMKERNVINLGKIHDKKIDLCEAIIIVTDKDGYYGKDTAREVMYAYKKDKRVLVTAINPHAHAEYYFNNDENYPLYMLKEVYQ